MGGRNPFGQKPGMARWELGWERYQSYPADKIHSGQVPLNADSKGDSSGGFAR